MSLIKVTKKEGIITLKINRPEKLNALNREIVDEIDKIVEEIAQDKQAKVLVIHSDKNFAAGADISEMITCNEEEAKAYVFSPTYNKIAALSIPSIAVIEGYALGGGLELALACDMRIAASNAKLGFPEINLGIMPGSGGTIRAPRIIGEAKAKELILLGRILNAEEALKIGLVNVVAAPDELEEIVFKWTEKLKNGPSIALAMAKKTIEMGVEENLQKGIELETKNWARLFNTEDQKEGMLAFTQKRKPSFAGM
jgi:enoyl-CoA hydratase/carnithine racemase